MIILISSHQITSSATSHQDRMCGMFYNVMPRLVMNGADNRASAVSGSETIYIGRCVE